MQSIVRHIETKTQIKLERETRIRSKFTREYLTLNIVTLKSMKSRKAKIEKEKDCQKKGGKKRQLQQHQWAKIKNPPLHHHQHSNTNIKKGR